VTIAATTGKRYKQDAPGFPVLAETRSWKTPEAAMCE